jgi:hypothetical protein
VVESNKPKKAILYKDILL